LNKIGRKIYHVTGGLILIAVYARIGREPGLWMLLGVTLFATALDLIRLKNQAFNRFIFKYFPKFIRDSEKNVLTGTPWYMMGILAAAALYSTPVAVYSVVFLACGDVAATTVGERWGTIKVAGKKSLQGTIAFYAASVIAGAVVSHFFYPMSAAVIIAGAVAASVVEIMPIPINDNLSIPVIAGAVMQLMVSSGM
jgi:dolichol kinase